MMGTMVGVKMSGKMLASKMDGSNVAEVDDVNDDAMAMMTGCTRE